MTDAKKVADWTERPLVDPHEGVSWSVSQTRKTDPRTIELVLEARYCDENDRYLWIQETDLVAMLAALRSTGDSDE